MAIGDCFKRDDSIIKVIKKEDSGYIQYIELNKVPAYDLDSIINIPNSQLVISGIPYYERTIRIENNEFKIKYKKVNSCPNYADVIFKQKIDESTISSEYKDDA